MNVGELTIGYETFLVGTVIAWGCLIGVEYLPAGLSDNIAEDVSKILV